jgi:hypothetical protein
VRQLSSLTPIYEEEEAPRSAISGSNLSIDSLMFSMPPSDSQHGSFVNNSYIEEEMFYQVPDDSQELDWVTLDEYLEDNLEGVEFGDAILGYEANPNIVPVTNIDDVSSDSDEGISGSADSSKNSYHFVAEGNLGGDVAVDHGAVVVNQCRFSESDPIFYMPDDSVRNENNSGINLGGVSQESSDLETIDGPLPPLSLTPPPVLPSQSSPPPPMTLSHIPIPPPQPVLPGHSLPPPVSLTGKHIPPPSMPALASHDLTTAAQNTPPPPPPPVTLSRHAVTLSNHANIPPCIPVKHKAPSLAHMPSDRSDSDSSSFSSDSVLASSTHSDGEASIKTNKSSKSSMTPESKPDYSDNGKGASSLIYQHSIEMTGDILTVTRQPKKLVLRNMQNRNAVKFWDEMGYPCPTNDKERTISLQKERKKNRQKMYFNTPHKKQMSSAYNRKKVGLGRNPSLTKAEKLSWTNSVGRGSSLPGKATTPNDRNLCLKTDNNLSFLRLGGVWEV